jgi:hypothetical protein
LRRGPKSQATPTCSSFRLLCDHFRFADLDLGSAAAKAGSEKIDCDFNLSQFIDFHAGQITEPDRAAVDPDDWRLATEEALCLKQGMGAATVAADDAIKRLRPDFNDTILISDPLCQAYSLVGRASSKGKVGGQAGRHARG